MMMTTETMTTTEKICAIEASGFPLAWDGCHKIYFLEDDGRRANAVELDYEIHPSTELRALIGHSCGLVFVSRWGYDNDDFAHDWNIAQCTDDIYVAAEG